MTGRVEAIFICPEASASMQPLTFAITLPSAISLYSLSATIWRSDFQWTPAAKFLAAAMVSWIVAGLQGLVNATIVLDVAIHNTMWIVGHFHNMALLNIGMVIFAAVYAMLPKITGKEWYSESLSNSHLWLTIIGGYGMVIPLLIQGLEGAPRRYAVLPERFDTLTQLTIPFVIILALGVGGIVLAIDDGTANTITVSEAVPSLGDAKTYLPVIIFMMLGFELISSLSEEIKEPQKIIPRTLFTAGGILAFLYMFATIGILLALPLEDLGLVEGLVDTFKAIFGTSGFGEVLVYALGIAAMYTFFTNMTTWSMGANRSAQEAAAAGELPAILGREHPVRRTPVGAYVVSGTVATAVLLFAAIFVGSQDDLFYAIFSASAVVFLMPYLLMFPCVVTLRRKDPETPRPYRVPGGMGVLVAMSAVTTLIIFATFLLFLWPEIPNAPEAWSFTGPLLAIVG